jgi:hypothetical protein
MPPEQSHPAGPQFDFIMNSEQRPKRGLFNVSSRSGKILLFLGLAAIVVILAGIALSALLSRSAARTNELVGLAQTQTEIARVAELGKTKTKDKTTLNYIMEVKLTASSHLSQTTAFLKERNHVINPKDLVKAKDSSTDTALKAAEQANNYDAVIMSTLKEELGAYRDNVKKEFDATGSAKEKTLLKSFYSQISTLLE